jgi:hypothetical protein
MNLHSKIGKHGSSEAQDVPLRAGTTAAGSKLPIPDLDNIGRKFRSGSRMTQSDRLPDKACSGACRSLFVLARRAVSGYS